MPSFIWTRSLDNVFEDPYEYGAQERFLREAETLWINFKEELSKFDIHFTTWDRSIKKLPES